MRIAMIGQKGIPASMARGGGIESHVEILSSKLQKRGNDLMVYVRPYTNPQKKRTWNKIRLITLPTIRRKHLDAIVHVFLSSIHVLFQKVDIIHYHGVGPSTLAWIPRVFKPSAKVVVTFHARDQFNEKWKWFAKIYLAFGEWTACKFPHLTIAVSHNLKLFCEHMFGKPAVYIPNAVDIPSKMPGTSFLKEIGVEPNEYIITLGRLIPIKAHEDAIKAFGNVITNKKLLIIGEPDFDNMSYQVKLEDLAMKDGRVVLMGRRTGDELHQLIAHCFCMIHPSKVEGLSVAILEAMSYGKMVVMSDIPGNRELVDHSGVAYPVGNAQKLAEILSWLLSDPILVKVRGERAREAVKRLYNWDKITAKTEEEYEKLLKNHEYMNL